MRIVDRPPFASSLSGFCGPSIRLLLAFGSSPMETDGSLWTALHHASAKVGNDDDDDDDDHNQADD